jgi:hypothetical protein
MKKIKVNPARFLKRGKKCEEADIPQSLVNLLLEKGLRVS